MLRTFSQTFFSPSYTGGDSLGFRLHGGVNGPGGSGLFDNLVVESVPEPSAAMLLGVLFGGLAVTNGLARSRRR